MKKPVLSNTIAWTMLGVVSVCSVSVLCITAGIIGWYYDGWFQPASPALAGTQSADSGLDNAPRVGYLAPDFKLYTINGDRVSLSGYRGQPVLVNFWTTWCDYCTGEMPMIQERFQRYAPLLVVLAVDEGEMSVNVSSFIRQYEYTFTVLLDSRLRVGNLYLVSGYPRSFFIDPDGVVRYIVQGVMFDEDIEAGLLSIGVLE